MIFSVIQFANAEENTLRKCTERASANAGKNIYERLSVLLEQDESGFDKNGEVGIAGGTAISLKKNIKCNGSMFDSNNISGPDEASFKCNGSLVKEYVYENSADSEEFTIKTTSNKAIVEQIELNRFDKKSKFNIKSFLFKMGNDKVGSNITVEINNGKEKIQRFYNADQCLGYLSAIQTKEGKEALQKFAQLDQVVCCNLSFESETAAKGKSKVKTRRAVK